MSGEGDQSRGRRALRIWLRRIGPIIGLALLMAALFMVWTQRQTVLDALGAIGHRPPADLTLHIAVILATIGVNIICTAAMFNLLLRRHGEVGWLEMQALIAASTLLNYIPLRPGLFGRVAYHRLYNNITVAASVKAIMQAIALSLLCVALLGGIVSIAWPGDRAMWLAVLAPLAGLALGAALLGMSAQARPLWPHAGAAAVRYLDLLATALRYQVAFSLLAQPIDFAQAAALACVAVLATMVPFLSNGLGLREWAIGLAAPLLAASQVELAITADLLNRAAEFIVIIPMGLAGIIYLARLRRSRT